MGSLLSGTGIRSRSGVGDTINAMWIMPDGSTRSIGGREHAEDVMTHLEDFNIDSFDIEEARERYDSLMDALIPTVVAMWNGSIRITPTGSNQAGVNFSPTDVTDDAFQTSQLMIKGRIKELDTVLVDFIYSENSSDPGGLKNSVKVGPRDYVKADSPKDLKDVTFSGPSTTQRMHRGSKNIDTSYRKSLTEFLVGEIEFEEFFNDRVDQVLFEFSFSPEEFADQVIEIIKNARVPNTDSHKDVRQRLIDQLEEGNFDVETTSKEGTIAFVRGKPTTPPEIDALVVNMSAFESLTEKDFKYISAHEASHILTLRRGVNHDLRFYEKLRELLEDNFGFEQFQEQFERDVIVSGDKRTNVELILPAEDQIFVTREEVDDIMDKFFSSFNPYKGITDEFEDFDLAEITEETSRIMNWSDWNGRGAVRTEKGGEAGLTSTIEVSRGRGKSRLPFIEINRKTEGWEILEAERWIKIDDFDIETTEDGFKPNLDLSTPDVSGSGLDDLRNILDDIREDAVEFGRDLRSELLI